MGVLNGRFLGMSPGNLSEAYSGASDDGLWDDVDLSDHSQESYAQSGAAVDPSLRSAWLILILALGALWFLGGIMFRVSIQ